MTQCLGSNAKAKKLLDDDDACMSKCPADKGGPSTPQTGGGGDSSDTPADPASQGCWDACGKQYDAACAADQAACDTAEACEDKCFKAQSSGAEGTTSASNGGSKDGNN
jgi:hypothetical protein